MRNHSKCKFWCFLPLIPVAIAAFSYVTMLLWNALLPVIFHLPLITFWQALGLMILARLLFGSFCHRGAGHHRHFGHDFRNKWETMTPEEREQFMKMRNSCRPSWGRYCNDKKEEENLGTGKV
jgi:hypothetical protein